MSGETENREDILPRSFAFGSHCEGVPSALRALSFVKYFLCVRKRKSRTLRPPITFRY